MQTVSVIIPTWNRATTLERAINSALNQTYAVKEVLVCDDGSSDNSKDLVANMGNDKVKWIEGPRYGLPAVPRNRGILASTGDWIAFLDSDDEWLPFKIGRQMDLLTRLECEASCGNAFRILPEEEIAGEYLSPSQDILRFNQLVDENRVICSSALIRKTIIRRAGFFPEAISLKGVEDYAYWLRVASFTNWTYLSEPIMKYYDDPANSVRYKSVSEVEQRIRVFKDYLGWSKHHKNELRSLILAKKKELVKNMLSSKWRIVLKIFFK